MSCSMRFSNRPETVKIGTVTLTEASHAPPVDGSATNPVVLRPRSPPPRHRLPPEWYRNSVPKTAASQTVQAVGGDVHSSGGARTRERPDDRSRSQRQTEDKGDDASDPLGIGKYGLSADFPMSKRMASRLIDRMKAHAEQSKRIRQSSRLGGNLVSRELPRLPGSWTIRRPQLPGKLQRWREVLEETEHCTAGDPAFSGKGPHYSSGVPASSRRCPSNGREGYASNKSRYRNWVEEEWESARATYYPFDTRDRSQWDAAGLAPRVAQTKACFLVTSKRMSSLLRHPHGMVQLGSDGGSSEFLPMDTGGWALVKHIAKILKVGPSEVLTMCRDNDKKRFQVAMSYGPKPEYSVRPEFALIRAVQGHSATWLNPYRLYQVLDERTFKSMFQCLCHGTMISNINSILIRGLTPAGIGDGDGPLRNEVHMSGFPPSDRADWGGHPPRSEWQAYVFLDVAAIFNTEDRFRQEIFVAPNGVLLTRQTVELRYIHSVYTYTRPYGWRLLWHKAYLFYEPTTVVLPSDLDDNSFLQRMNRGAASDPQDFISHSLPFDLCGGCTSALFQGFLNCPYCYSRYVYYEREERTSTRAFWFREFGLIHGYTRNQPYQKSDRLAVEQDEELMQQLVAEGLIGVPETDASQADAGAFVASVGTASSGAPAQTYGSSVSKKTASASQMTEGQLADTSKLCQTIARTIVYKNTQQRSPVGQWIQRLNGLRKHMRKWDMHPDYRLSCAKDGKVRVIKSSGIGTLPWKPESPTDKPPKAVRLQRHSNYLHQFFYLSLLGVDGSTDEEVALAKEFMAGHLWYCDDDHKLEERPCPVVLMNQIRNGQADRVARQLLGGPTWDCYYDDIKNEYMNLLNRACSIWDSLLSVRTGVLPPEI